MWATKLDYVYETDEEQDEVIKMIRQKGLEFDTNEVLRDFWSNLRIKNREVQEDEAYIKGVFPQEQF